VTGNLKLPAFIFALALAGASAFAGDDAAQESLFITNPRQLIFEGRRSGEGYFSPDASKLIFQREREEGNPFYQMYVLDLSTGDITPSRPAWAKQRAVFSSPIPIA
jgi:Tol biopolymer transport system component